MFVLLDVAQNQRVILPPSPNRRNTTSTHDADMINQSICTPGHDAEAESDNHRSESR